MTIFLLRRIIGKNKNKPLTFSSRTKHPGLDIFKYRAYFFEFGLLVTLAIIYLLLQWTVPYHIPGHDENEDLSHTLDIDIIRTAETENPVNLKKVERPVDEFIIEMVDEMEEPAPIDELITSDSNSDGHVAEEVPEIPEAPPLPVDLPLVEDLPVLRAEQMPRFPGCEALTTEHDKSTCAEAALLQFLYKNIKYPALARENGVEGTCVIRFIVEKDGSINDAKIIRDIGAGCGAESLRVVTLMNTLTQRWTPGKQGGRPVRVQFNLPLKFSLQ